MAENNSGVVDSPMILDNDPSGSNSKDNLNEERIEMAELNTVTDDSQITTVLGSEDSTSRGKAIF